MRSAHGFTLLELMVTMTIIGIAGALVVTATLPNGNQSMKTAAYRIADIIETTHSLSLSHQETLALSFEETGIVLWAMEQKTEDGEPQVSFRKVDPAPFEMELPETIDAILYASGERLTRSSKALFPPTGSVAPFEARLNSSISKTTASVACGFIGVVRVTLHTENAPLS